jgi:hypothetical protein
MTGSTIVEPPPVDPERSVVENALELTPLADIGPVSGYFDRISVCFLR